MSPRRMVEAEIKGRIINLSSKNGFCRRGRPGPLQRLQGRIELLTQSLAIELEPTASPSITIAPGIIETEIGGEFDLDPAFFPYYLEHIPLEHPVRPGGGLCGGGGVPGLAGRRLYDRSAPDH